MWRIFDMENPVMRALGAACDLLLLNLQLLLLRHLLLLIQIQLRFQRRKMLVSLPLKTLIVLSFLFY